MAACGLGSHDWPSVNRTARFYLEALTAMGARVLHTADGGWPRQAIDIGINFSGGDGWERAAGPRDFPLMFAMHGGCVLDAGFLRGALPRLTTHDALIVNCQSDADILRAMCGQAEPLLEILPLPVDTTLFTPEGRAAARAQLGLGADTFCVGIVARLLPQKNIHGALELVAELIARNPGRDVRVVIVGNFWIDYKILRFDDQPYSARLRALIERHGLTQRVSYLPAKLSDQELAAAYRSFDVLLHPTNSIDENFGYAPVEAMASGVPVVGCAYGGLKETVRDGVTGFLAPTWLSYGGLREDRGALLRGLEQLLRSATAARAMSAQARRHALAHYGTARAAATLQASVRRCLARRDGAPPRALATTAAADMSAYDRFLAPRHDRLSDYAASILRYVSHACPRVAPGMALRAYAGYADDGVAVTLDNPAWPARYPVSARRRDILRRAGTGRAVEQLAGGGAQELDDMLELGLLVPCAAADR